jgi:2-polyprenyl-3-methyl-5-hydroxy-6-metoxy-1,4-benzoquinol methylase
VSAPQAPADPKADALPYHFKPFAGSPHAWAIRELGAVEPGKRVRILDVGAATGEVGLAARAARGGAAELTGIEIEATARAELERRYDRVLASLDALPDADRFDVALLLDVIEHTTDPVAILARTARALGPGGVLLVSVPNVAHWSVRFSLLFGRFEYARSGILDRTHLRFFTRRSFRQTLAQAGLEVVGEAFAVEPVELLWPALDRNLVWRALRAVRRGVAWLWPGLFAFQLLARCRAGR